MRPDRPAGNAFGGACGAFGAATAVLTLLLTPTASPAPMAPAAVSVTGRVAMVDAEARGAEDVGQTVVWLEREGLPAAPPITARMANERKQFTPRVLVVPAGSTVAFANHDPFDHNVFSSTEGSVFDLGLYGRGETRDARLSRPGVVRVYCNVHAQMSAVVVVRDGPHYTMAASDGSFTLPAVAPGRYVLHAWHERAPEAALPVRVGAGGLADVVVRLDARGWRPKPHLNKFGRPYPKPRRRY